MREPYKRLFRLNTLLSTCDRATYFPGAQIEYEDMEDDNPELTGEFPHGHSISLSKINQLLKDQGISDENAYLTASFSDDYLCLEVVNIVRLTEQQQEADYQSQQQQWDERQQAFAANERQQLEQQMQFLQARLFKLKTTKEDR